MKQMNYYFCWLAVTVLLLTNSKDLLAQPDLGNQIEETETNQGDVDSRRPPNLIILLADDLGYGELGCQGNHQIPTPHIDSLAQQGLRFTAGYVTASYCSPSRAGLLTGKYQSRFGYEMNPTGAANEDPEIGLPASEKTLASSLHDLGYATGLIGKWHLGGTAHYHPQRRGFDDFFGFLHEGHFFVPPPYHGVSSFLRRRTLPGGKKDRWGDERYTLSTHTGRDEPPYDANNPILRSSQPVIENDYLTDAFTREACQFIERNQQRPFFLYLAYNAVHSPMQGAEKYLQRFAHIPDLQRRVFAAMLANLDDSVGTLLYRLDQLELTENTCIVFLSDNGGPTQELTSSNAPLRGGKGDMYEGGIRVPFLMQFPRKIPAGYVEARAVCSLDLFPTFLDLAGADHHHEFDGVNLMPYLNFPANATIHETLYWRQNQRAALRHGDWKLVNHSLKSKKSNWELYHLHDDLSESKNLAETEPATRNRLIAIWDEFAQQMPNPQN